MSDSQKVRTMYTNDGECDDIPESYFLFAGTIDEVFEKAKKQ